MGERLGREGELFEVWHKLYDVCLSHLHVHVPVCVSCLVSHCVMSFVKFHTRAALRCLCAAAVLALLLLQLLLLLCLMPFYGILKLCSLAVAPLLLPLPLPLPLLLPLPLPYLR